MSDQRRRRWTDVVQMLYKCFVFAGLWWNAELHYIKAICKHHKVHLEQKGIGPSSLLYSTPRQIDV